MVRIGLFSRKFGDCSAPTGFQQPPYESVVMISIFSSDNNSATYLLRNPQKLRVCTKSKFFVVCEEVLVDQIPHLGWKVHKSESCLIVELVQLLDVDATVLLGLRRHTGARLDEGAELIALDVVVAEAVLANRHVESDGVGLERGA